MNNRKEIVTSALILLITILYSYGDTCTAYNSNKNEIITSIPDYLMSCYIKDFKPTDDPPRNNIYSINYSLESQYNSTASTVSGTVSGEY